MNNQEQQTWQKRQTSQKAVRIFLCTHSSSRIYPVRALMQYIDLVMLACSWTPFLPKWRQCTTAVSFGGHRICRQGWATLSLQMAVFTKTALLPCWRFPPESKASKGAPQIHPCKGVCVQLVWSWAVLTLVISHQSGLRIAHAFACAWWRAGWDYREGGWLHVGNHSNVFKARSRRVLLSVLAA